jgi:hypothetical protein
MFLVLIVKVVVETVDIFEVGSVDMVGVEVAVIKFFVEKVICVLVNFFFVVIVV